MHPNFIIGGEEFPLVTREVIVSGKRISLALVPYDTVQLERIIRIRGLRERVWPYWLEEWPATYALAEALDKEDSVAWKGPVLDLGCGSGFLAAFLRLRFGIEPFSCDFNADACRLAAYNAHLPANDAHSQKDSIAPTRIRPGAKVFCADFNAFPSRLVFGLVFAGEMLYTRDNHKPILDFLHRHLAPGGQAHFADAGRSAASGFSTAAEAAGFAVAIAESRTRGDDRNMHVYTLRRMAGAEAGGRGS